MAKDNTTDKVTMIFVGDIMVAHDEETGKLIERGVDPFEPCADLLKNADITIGNLECVVAEKGERVKKPYNFRADPRCIPLLKQHFTAFSVANNHSGDFGKAAFVEQCDRLEAAHIPYFGGGRNKADAHKPWIIDRHGVRIALLGYCEVYSEVFPGGRRRARRGLERARRRSAGRYPHRPQKIQSRCRDSLHALGRRRRSADAIAKNRSRAK